MTQAEHDRIVINLQKTFEIIQTCFDLKAAFLRRQYPGKSNEEINALLCRQMIERKERAWKSVKD
ncbi:hypothetical protein JW935_00850 [candidate division KSB1 bacterium]|nr:hypothetical protein [candidate division KSB1 bacterium]